jgi:hypothetical protein
VGDGHDDGGDRRAGPALDDLPGARALVDVQRRGLLAANELVERLVRSVDGDRDDRAGAGTDAGGRPSGRDGAAAAGTRLGPADDLMRLWLQLVRVGLDALGHLLPPDGAGERADGPHVATVDTDGTAIGAVRISVTPVEPLAADGANRPGAELWLHNGSRVPITGVALHCGDLRAADGAVLPAASVRFDPPVVDLPARSSRGVDVSVDADLPAGTYHGVVLAAGIPDAWLPLKVVVAAPRRGD